MSDTSQYEAVLYQEELNVYVEQQRFCVFALVKPRIFIDQNQWCCLYGEDMQNCIVGFGDTAYDAMMDWNKAWYKKVEHTPTDTVKGEVK